MSKTKAYFDKVIKDELSPKEGMDLYVEKRYTYSSTPGLRYAGTIVKIKEMSKTYSFKLRERNHYMNKLISTKVWYRIRKNRIIVEEADWGEKVVVQKAEEIEIHIY